MTVSPLIKSPTNRPHKTVTAAVSERTTWNDVMNDAICDVTNDEAIQQRTWKMNGAEDCDSGPLNVCCETPFKGSWVKSLQRELAESSQLRWLFIRDSASFPKATAAAEHFITTRLRLSGSYLDERSEVIGERFRNWLRSLCISFRLMKRRRKKRKETLISLSKRHSHW